MKVVMVDYKFIESIQESLESGEKDFTFITPDGNSLVECKIKERFSKGRMVRCSEDDKVFKSLTEASCLYGCTQPEISIAIKNRTKCRGYHFHYWYNEEHAKKFDEWVKFKHQKKTGLE